MNPTFISKYTLINKIGEGAFSEVLKCEHKQTGELFAAKRLKKRFKNLDEVSNCAEIMAMNKLSKHPNIVYMLEFHYNISSGHVIFIFELMDMSMYEYIKLKKKRIPEKKVKRYFFQVLKGLQHLHSHGIFHRDLKPENILIKMSRVSEDAPAYQCEESEIVKLADFGSIRGIFSKQPYSEYIATRWYRAPECLLTVGYYGSKMDIWALGCVFYEMLTLEPLFAGENEIDQLGKIHKVLGSPNPRILRKIKKKSHNFFDFPKKAGIGFKPLTKQISPDYVEILQLMLHYDPDTRINVRRLLDHRFFKTLHERDKIQFQTNKTRINEVCTNRNKGDFHSIFSISPNTSQNKYKSSPTRSHSNDKGPEKIKVSRLSKTTADIINYKPDLKHHHNLLDEHCTVDRKQMRAWGVNPNILKAKEELPNSNRVPSSLKRYKLPGNETNNISKTTSNLPQMQNYNNILESIRAKHFISKSYVVSKNLEKNKKLLERKL